METNVCGCGRTILELIDSAHAMKQIDKALARESKESKDTPDIVVESMKGARDIFRMNFGQWLGALQTECGMNKEIVERVYSESKSDMDKAISTLREALIKCAGMTH